MGLTFLKSWRGALLSAALCAASAALANPAKHEAPIPAPTLALMAAKGTGPAAPILVRIYKKEAELEVWKQARGGRYVHLKTFPICRWSGQLGPKRRQGDRQAPEGFYSVTPKQMNPNSAYYLSFDLGFPNAYDRAHGATGAFLMVHGTCSSSGCYAMTDAQVGEIYALAREAFSGGQGAFQVQAFPFRMTARNMARHRSDPHIAFWRQLKEGSDRFEATGEEPAVGVADGRYAFPPARDPAREAAAKARMAEEEARTAALVADGSAAVRTTYSDGGGHPTFRYASLSAPATLGQVSRPEALAAAGREVILVPERKKARTQLAGGKAGAPDVLETASVAGAGAAADGPRLAAAAGALAFAPWPGASGLPRMAGGGVPTFAALAVPARPPAEAARLALANLDPTAPAGGPGFMLANPNPVPGPEPSLFAWTALAPSGEAGSLRSAVAGSARIVPARFTSLRF